MKRNHIVYIVWSLQLVLLVSACGTGGTTSATQPVEPTTQAASPATTTAAVSDDNTPTIVATSAAAPAATPEAATIEVVLSPTIPKPNVITITATVEVTRPPLGTAERPVQLLFPPVTSSAVILQRAEPLAEALRSASGLEFVVGIADSEAALVELLCSAPTDTIGFISAAAYTIAHDRCAAQPALVAVQEDGLTWQMGMIVIRPGAAGELADLAGRRWAVADTHSLPNYLYFRAQMAEAGIEPGEIIPAPEESSALLALRNDEVDFTSAGYVPPIMPREQTWEYGQNEPEEWRLLGIPPTRSPIGYVIVAGEPEFGGYRIRDARSRLFDTTSDIFDLTRILALSEPIPNDTVVFGADFPLGLSRQVMTTMTGFAASEACGMSLCSADLFGWTGLEPADDAAYDPIRKIKDTLELEAADLWAELD